MPFVRMRGAIGSHLAYQGLRISSFGMRIGTSQLFTMEWPLIDSLGQPMASGFEFDVQVREIDCPTTIDPGYGDPISVGRGYVFDIMSSYAQVNIPDDAYGAADPLFQNNGTYRYVATNT